MILIGIDSSIATWGIINSLNENKTASEYLGQKTDGIQSLKYIDEYTNSISSPPCYSP